MGTVTAQVENVLGNVVTASSAPITVTMTGPGSYSVASTLAAASGIASFNLTADTLTTPGTYTVTGTSSGLTSAIATVVVTGPPAQVAAAGLPTALTVGSGPGMETAAIEDALGNTVPGSTAAITETITGPGGFSQTSTLNATAGTATFDLSSVVFTVPGTYVVATTSTGLTTSTVNIVVSPVEVTTTSFGALPVGTASSPITLTFTFPAGGTLALPSVVTQGTTGLDFADAGTGTCTTNGAGHVYAAGASCTVMVTFTPKAPGLRAGAVVLLDGNGHAVATGYLSGVGNAGLAGFNAGTIQTLAMTLPGGGTSFVNGITVDAAGNLYLVDGNQCLVDKYPTGGGAVTILVGNGGCASPHTTGIGGPATQVGLSGPWRAIPNGRGDLFVSDSASNVILKVDAVTQITTIYAGVLGMQGYTADGALAAGSAINTPDGLAVDGAGNLYFTDGGNNIVRRVDAVTGIMTTVAGTYNNTGAYGGDGGPATDPSVRLNYPLALALDGGGNLYISDTTNNLIRKLVLNTGVISRFAGQYHSPTTCTNAGDDTGDNGPATSADLCDPEGIAVDGGGNLYIADSTNRLVRKVNAATGTITVVAGTFAAGADAYTGDGGAANMAGLSYDEDVTVDGGGNFYIADSNNLVTREVTPAAGIVSFSSFDLGVSSPAADVTLTNSGNAALHVSSLLTTTNFNTNGGDTTCSSATLLAAGAGCVLGIEFLPTVAGSPLTGTVTLTDDANNIPASTQTVAISGTGVAGPKLALTTPPPSSVLAGGNLGAVTVSVESFGGTLNGSSTVSVTLTVTGPGGYSQTATQTAVGGLANFNLAAYALSAVGTYTVTATSSGITPAAATVTVAGAATQLAVTGLPSTLVSGGNLGTELAHVEDAQGNPVTNSTASVTVTITGPGGYSQVVTQAAVSGVATLNLSALVLTTPGTYTVTTTSTGLTTSVVTVIVTAAATQLAVTGLPATLVSGGNLGTLTVTLKDANGNLVPSSTAAVTVTITGPGGFTHAATAAAVAGIAGFNLGGLVLHHPWNLHGHGYQPGSRARDRDVYCNRGGDDRGDRVVEPGTDLWGERDSNGYGRARPERLARRHGQLL